MPILLSTVMHFGAPRRYFADGKLQDLYTRATGKRIVTDEVVAFLERAGVEVVEATA